jgi:hypothetical protein
MEYLPHERELISGVSLIINQYTNQLNFAQLRGFSLARTPIEFQFMPKILSDSRKGSWDESEVLGREPVSNIATAGPRIMSMRWTYIVEDIGKVPSRNAINIQNPFFRGIWDIGRIRKNLNVLKGYFLNAKRAHTSTHAGLVCQLTWPLIGGIGTWTCRITSIDIKHSENMVGNRDIMFPVKSDVTIDLRLWTRGTQDDIDAFGGDNAAIQNVDGMKPQPSFGDLWF